MIIAIDVDNTLALTDENLKTVISEPMRDLMRAVWSLGLAKIVVWSGGGWEYAERICRCLAVDQWVWAYADKGAHGIVYLRHPDPIDHQLNVRFGVVPDITIDDQDMTTGKVNLKIGMR